MSPPSSSVRDVNHGFLHSYSGSRVQLKSKTSVTFKHKVPLHFTQGKVPKILKDVLFPTICHSPSEMEAQARRMTFFVAQSPKMPSDRDAPEEAVERRALQLAIIHARAAQGSVPNTKYSPTDDAAHVGEMSIIDLRQEVRTSKPPRHAQSVGICAPPP